MRNSGIVSLVPLLSLLLLKFFIFWYLQDSFSDVLELTTLKSSMKNLHESIFLYRQGIPLFHLPDSMNVLLIVLFSSIPKFMYPIFLFLVDLVTSLGVFLIYEEYTKKIQTTIQEEKKEKKERLNIYLTPYLHILNPLAWLSLFSSNLNIISNCLVVFSVYFSLRNLTIESMGCLALASFIFVQPMVFLVPLVILLSYHRRQGLNQDHFKLISLLPVLIYCIWLVSLLGFSYLAAGQNWDFLQFYYFYYSLSDLTPNIGLFWNLFINVLKNYPAIFYFVFHTLLLFIPIPLALKFRSEPYLLLALVMIFGIILKPYPTLSDVALLVPFAPLLSYLYPYLSHALILVLVPLFGFCAFPINYYWWIYQGSGNANFYYATTLVTNMSLGVLGLALIKAQLAYEICRDNPSIDPLKVIRE